jgi:hypothetical protein
MVGVYETEEGREGKNTDLYKSLQSHLNSVKTSDYIAAYSGFGVGQQRSDRILGMEYK